MTERRREFKQSTRIEIAERAKDSAGIIRCEGVGIRAPGRCNNEIKGKRQFDHIITCWAGGEATADNGQLLCLDCYTIKNKKDAGDKGKNDRMKAKALGVETKSKQAFPQRAKTDKPPPKPLPVRQGGIYARFYGKETS